MALLLIYLSVFVLPPMALAAYVEHDAKRLKKWQKFLDDNFEE